MKEFWKKKIGFFGKQLSILTLLLVVVGGLASASLVKYLSNTITQQAEVTSPLEMTGGILVSTDVYGGEDIAYTVTTTNHANTAIWSFAVTEVTAPVGTTFSGNEFTNINLKDNNHPDGVDITSMMKYVKSDGTLADFSTVGADNLNTVKIVFDNGVTFDSSKGYIRSVGFNEYNDIKITTSPAITPGKYTIKSCQLYDLKGDC